MKHRAPRPTSGRTLQVGVVVGAAVLAAVALPSAASGATVTISTGAELVAAFGTGCNDNNTYVLANDINDSFVLPIECTGTLDLAGHDVQTANNVVIAAGKTFTVMDSSTAAVADQGTFFVAGGVGRPGIRTTGATLRVEGGIVRATAGDRAAGIGGGYAPTIGAGLQHAGTLIMTGGGIVTTGGAGVTSGAGIGGGESGDGGTVTITGGEINANGGQGAAAIGGGHGGAAGTITIGGSALIAQATGGPLGAGIGSGSSGAADGKVSIRDSANVTATGGTQAAGIGGGSQSSIDLIEISGGTVAATGVGEGAGIGSGYLRAAKTIAISGGVVAASGGNVFSTAGFPTGAGGAGIGGGLYGNGGDVTISGDAAVTATGSVLSAGIGAGRYGNGGSVSIGSAQPTVVSGGRSVGAAGSSATSGVIEVSGTLVLNPPPYYGDGGIELLDSEPGAELTVTSTGLIRGSVSGAQGTSGSGATISGSGQVVNNGVISLIPSSVTSPVTNRHYTVTFDTQGGSTAPSPVTVYAKSFTDGVRSFPADPTKGGQTFLGWNTKPNGSGTAITATSTLPGASTDGTPVPVTAYAVWAAPASITGSATATGVVGSPFSYTPTLGGAPAPVVSSTALPPGLSLDSATGEISGTPTAVGVTEVTLTATNATGTDDFVVTIGVEPAAVPATISGAATAAATVGEPFTYAPNIGGFPAPTVTADQLPAGLTVSATTGVISGTPTTTGSTEVTLTATNGSGSATHQVTITVAAAPVAATITGAATASGPVNAPFSYSPTVNGFPAPTVSANGLPSGLSVDPATGAITGTPTETGDSQVTLTASNSAGSDQLTLTISVTEAPVLDGETTVTGVVGEPFSYEPNVTGFPVPAVSSSALPDGLTVDPTTGAITGTPTAAGVTTVQLSAGNTVGTAFLAVTITITPAPVAPQLSGEGTALGEVGSSFAYVPSVTGFPAPSVTATDLPAGLSVNSLTGRISGTPTADGTATVTLTATNSVGSDTLEVTITILKAPIPQAVNGAPIARTFAKAAYGLRVEGERPAGYTRDAFQRWDDVDGDCQDTASEVLRRATRIPATGRCAVTGGRWTSLYDRVLLNGISRARVIPMIPWAEAWESGARSWSPATRRAFANDLTGAFSLFVASDTLAAARGSSDPTTWTPRSSACTYLARWTAVKLRWNLSVDSAERTRLIRASRSCPEITFQTTKAVVQMVPAP